VARVLGPEDEMIELSRYLEVSPVKICVNDTDQLSVLGP
jgi:hypothetical protein